MLNKINTLQLQFTIGKVKLTMGNKIATQAFVIIIVLIKSKLRHFSLNV